MKLVEFLVSKISYYHSNKSYVVVLNEVNGDRRLPIMLGSYEAQAIAIAMESIDTQRPLTHDLLINALQGLGLSLKNVTIKRCEEEIFFLSTNPDVVSLRLCLKYLYFDTCSLGACALCPFYPLEVREFIPVM